MSTRNTTIATLSRLILALPLVLAELPAAITWTDNGSLSRPPIFEAAGLNMGNPTGQTDARLEGSKTVSGHDWVWASNREAVFELRLTATGVAYFSMADSFAKLGTHSLQVSVPQSPIGEILFKVSVNPGPTDPNPSLELYGLQIGSTVADLTSVSHVLLANSTNPLVTGLGRLAAPQSSMIVRGQMRWITSDKQGWNMGSYFAVEAAPTPEPGTVALCGLALVGLGLYSRSRTRKAGRE